MKVEYVELMVGDRVRVEHYGDEQTIEKIFMTGGVRMARLSDGSTVATTHLRKIEV